MAYADFTLEMVEAELDVGVQSGTILPSVKPCVVPTWLDEQIHRSMAFSLLSEKSRSEFIVAPVLLAVREILGKPLSILSGLRMDIDPARKLTGECDFLLSLTAPLPMLRAPIFAVVEAKKHDIEAGLGQCVAQMVGAQLFNQRAGPVPRAIFGCVTNAENWQFLRLENKTVIIEEQRLYLKELDLILGTFLQALSL